MQVSGKDQEILCRGVCDSTTEPDGRSMLCERSHVLVYQQFVGSCQDQDDWDALSRVHDDQAQLIY